MSSSSALILLGILTILAPLSGLPESWITVLLALFGLIVALLGISLRSESVRRAKRMMPSAPVAAPTSEPVIEHHSHEHRGPSAIS